MDTRSERLKERHGQQYREADRTVKRMTRADKRVYVEDLASQAEKSTNRGEEGQVYKITKRVSGKYRGATDTPVVDTHHGSRAGGETSKAFERSLNRHRPTIESKLQDSDSDADASIAPLEKDEI